MRIKVWGIGGPETPVIPDEPDVLDGGDVVEGLGGHGWRRVVECVGEGWRFLQGAPVLLFPWINWNFAMHRTKCKNTSYHNRYE
jgi:hypothetical protein